MHGFWGVTTTAADMNALRLANAQASYSGFTFGADGAPTGVVNMLIQFGPGTFSADFGAELGASLTVANPLKGTVVPTQSGVSQVSGHLIFNASGTVKGSQFSSDTLRIAGAGNSITGKVEGALFGSQAKVAAGAVDVTATLGARPTTPPPSANTATPAKLAPSSPQVVRYSTAFYTTRQP